MTTINHTFDPDQAVYVIDSCDDNNLYVVDGTVIRVLTSSVNTGVTITYDVRLGSGSGTISFVEADVFVDKPTAIIEYANRIE